MRFYSSDSSGIPVALDASSLDAGDGWTTRSYISRTSWWEKNCAKRSRGLTHAWPRKIRNTATHCKKHHDARYRQNRSAGGLRSGQCGKGNRRMAQTYRRLRHRRACAVRVFRLTFGADSTILLFGRIWDKLVRVGQKQSRQHLLSTADSGSPGHREKRRERMGSAGWTTAAYDHPESAVVRLGSRQALPARVRHRDDGRSSRAPRRVGERPPFDAARLLLPSEERRDSGECYC